MKNPTECGGLKPIIIPKNAGGKKVSSGKSAGQKTTKKNQPKKK